MRPAVTLRNVLVLAYHGVSDTWPSGLAVRTGRLRSQIADLLGRGYTPRTFADALANGGHRVFVVTFDDGLRSVLELGLPILQDLDVPATIFLPTRYMGRDEPAFWPGVDHWKGTEHETELTPLDWEEVRTLARDGWEIGSHTHTHPRLTELEPDDLARELEESKRLCEAEVGSPCNSLAYPYGNHDGRVVEAARRAGYLYACTLPERFLTASALTWPRVGIYADDGRAAFAVKTCPLVLRARRSSAWLAASAIRRAAARRGAAQA